MPSKAQDGRWKIHIVSKTEGVSSLYSMVTEEVKSALHCGIVFMRYTARYSQGSIGRCEMILISQKKESLPFRVTSQLFEELWSKWKKRF
jgi:hypothetical protein